MTKTADRKTAAQGARGCVFVALGANLPSSRGSPRETLEAALDELCRTDVTLVRLSRWYETAPVPDLDQPWYVNAVAEIATELGPEALLARLHEIEARFGRERRERWAARVVDLDLIDHRGAVLPGPAPQLPHPRMAERAFVLVPLRDVAPGWRHPVNGRSVDELIDALPSGQDIRPMAGQGH